MYSTRYTCTAASQGIGKMKKLVKMTKLMKMIKLVLMRLRSSGRSKVSLRLPRYFGQPLATQNWG